MGTAWMACGDGGEWRARTVANGGGGDGFFRQHLPCILLSSALSMCSGEEKGRALIGEVSSVPGFGCARDLCLIVPGSKQGPGPMRRS